MTGRKVRLLQRVISCHGQGDRRLQRARSGDQSLLLTAKRCRYHYGVLVILSADSTSDMGKHFLSATLGEGRPLRRAVGLAKTLFYGVRRSRVGVGQDARNAVAPLRCRSLDRLFRVVFFQRSIRAASRTVARIPVQQGSVVSSSWGFQLVGRV